MSWRASEKGGTDDRSPEKTRKRARGIDMGDIHADAVVVNQGQRQIDSDDLEAIPRSIDKYDVIEKIGSGSYGCVFLVKEIDSGAIVALKMIQLECGKDIQSHHTREFSSLQEIRNPFIIEVHRVFVEDDYICLVMEYLPMDLRKLINSPISDVFDGATTLKSFMKQLLTAVDFCHMNNFIHRDLKPDNILIDLKGGNITMKLADFGQSRGWLHGAAKLTPEVNSLSFRAPEVLLGSQQYTTSIDLWAVGCIFCYILLGEYMFKGDTSNLVLEAIVRVLGTPTEPSEEFWTVMPQWDKISDIPGRLPLHLGDVLPDFADSDNGLDLIKRLLVWDPSARISAAEALEHPYITN